MMDAAPPTLESTVDDDWVKLAMKDDVAVVGILLNIKHADPPPLLCYGPSPSSLKLEWSVRQRRSKHVTRQLSHVDKKKAEESNKGSPTTPLSWSGGSATSVSGGEESKPRSNKVAVASSATIKRSRKRKTLVQLKDEECLLLKERCNLKKELQTLRRNVEKQRATNENLKKIKLQQTVVRVAPSSASGEGVWFQPEQVNAVGELSRVMDLGNSGMVHEVLNCREAVFPVPDLNLPFEETQNPEAFYGIC